jgi:hypothetical protein
VIPDDFVGVCCLVNRRRAEILIDAADLDHPGAAGAWVTMITGRTPTRVWVYAVRRANHVALLLHRVITNCPPDMVVDHRNGRTLDNRRSNLRVCSRAENSRNRARNRNNKLGLKGVTQSPCGGYIAHIRVNGKGQYLGYFPSPESAHHAYCEAARRLHGEFARFA